MNHIFPQALWPWRQSRACVPIMIWYNSKSQPNLEWYYNTAPSLSRFTLVLPRLGGGGCSLGPWADYLCLPSWSWFPSSYWVTLSLLRLRVCLWVECSCHFKWVYPVSPWSKIQCWCSERVLFIQSFLLTFNPGICGLYMDTRFQGPALRETTGYIYCWWSYSHILTWLLKKS